MAVTDYLDRGTLVNPDGVCVVAGDVRLTYRELSVLVNRVANGLLAAGLGSGRSVAVLCDNEPRGYACTLGVMRSGAAYVPLDFRNSADDNARSLDFGDCEALFFGRRFQGQVEELAERLPGLKLLVCLEERVGSWPALDEWLAGQPDAAPPVEVPLEATAWLQTGSGTSGDFRMAMISYVGGDTGGEVADDFRLAAAGRPSLPFCRLTILDDDGRSLPQGEVGEICVRGDQVMSGYYKNPEATEKTIVDGWLHTGDVGFLDDDGYVHLVDRKRDLVISGGFNVYPSEVEHAIASLDAVAECAVIGVPDDDWGEAVKAIVELRPGAALTEAEVIARCKERVGSVKAPKSVDFVGEPPRSQRGKILKRVLRDVYREERTRRV